MNTVLLPILIAASFGGWAFLSLVGGERTRRAREIEDALKAEKEAAALKEKALANAANNNKPTLPSVTKTK